MAPERTATAWLSVCFALFLCLALIRPVQSSTTGLGSNPFPGIPDMQEVSCSGAGLPPGSYPYALFIYEKRGDRIISSVDIPKRECSTSDFFNACEINDRDNRLTKLRILVPNLHEGETRVFGCNASIKTGRGRFQEVSWFITLRHFSEW
ncbi:uncharacterized protein [Littorina saxatilis]|uniref:uncharacterized protein n=1 Tax=Littorina saxatilis TaxID=31220 RepID=UPI0038B4249F